MENWLILDNSLDLCILLLDADTVDCLHDYSLFIMFVVFQQDALTRYIGEWSPCTFIYMLASNHFIKLVNTGISTCHSTMDR